MEIKKPRHLTASGQIKPSVRLARRKVAKDGRVPTYLSAAFFNRVQEEIARSLYVAGVTDKPAAPSAEDLALASFSPEVRVRILRGVISLERAKECLRQEEGSAPVIVAGVDVQRAGILVSVREYKL